MVIEGKEAHGSASAPHDADEAKRATDCTADILAKMGNDNYDFDNDHDDIDPFTPQDVRMAARCYKATTAIGSDNWRFTDIANMPDEVLWPLAHLLNDIKASGIPPLQAFTNIMST